MLILALDTTTRPGSCAVVHDGRLVGERIGGSGQAHAAHLPADLMTLLESAQLSLGEIDAFAVAAGPGSFTGLRIGIATMQGLAFAEAKPLFAVSALDALAAAAAGQADGRPIVAWIDAWRGDVYHALYRGGEALAPTVSRPDDLLASLSLDAGELLFTGDGVQTHQDLIRRIAGSRVRLASPTAPPLAGTVGLIACTAAAAGERPGPDAIRPVYVRRFGAGPAR